MITTRKLTLKQSECKQQMVFHFTFFFFPFSHTDVSHLPFLSYLLKPQKSVRRQMPKFIIFYMDSHLISHDNFLKELFFLLLCCLGCKCKGLFLNSHSYSIDFYVSTNSLDYCRFSVNSEVRKCQSLIFISHFLGCFQFLSFPYHFGNRLPISEKKNKS